MLKYSVFYLSLFLVSYGSNNLANTLSQTCTFLYDVVGSIAFIMILLSSISYAISQVLPADPRAKVLVYGQNLFVGAILGIILLLIIPEIIAVLIGARSFNPQNCTFST
ncbi:MAG: hypothetical protein NZ908_03055 [Candidatus Micrarchaeota archaeon]|nr:hypothetical protein [Candidatus Micrarchaeota archaeon]MCX8154769.1 hypothetical protein [Candidatus Micrarchaeota archaeon]